MQSKEQKMQQLLSAPECRYDFRGTWKQLSKAEEDNWWARQQLVFKMHREDSDEEVNENSGVDFSIDANVSSHAAREPIDPFVADVS